MGGILRAGLQEVIDRRGLGDRLAFEGFDCRFRLMPAGDAAAVKAHVQRQFLQDGILWNMQFVPSFAHQASHVERTVASFDRAMSDLPDA